MIGHKTSLNKLKKIEMISSIFSDHKGLKLETNLKKKTPKHSNSRRLNSMLLNHEWVKNEIRDEIKKFLETNIPSKWTGKKAGVAILIFKKIDFKTQAIKRDTEGHFIILKGRIHQEAKIL